MKVRFGKAEAVLEALQVAENAISEAESFVENVRSDLENLVVDMQRYNDGDDKDTLLDGISNFISEIENILSGL